MVSEMEIPETFGQRMDKLKDIKVFPHPDHPDWWNREINKQAEKDLTWAAPYDARFPQVRKQRHCFTYYVDYFRCKELMGEEYKPCQFFQNVYNDICPKYWVEKWNEWREEGRFPARFDR